MGLLLLIILAVSGFLYLRFLISRSKKKELEELKRNPLSSHFPVVLILFLTFLFNPRSVFAFDVSQWGSSGTYVYSPTQMQNADVWASTTMTGDGFSMIILRASDQNYSTGTNIRCFKTGNTCYIGKHNGGESWLNNTACSGQNGDVFKCEAIGDQVTFLKNDQVILTQTISDILNAGYIGFYYTSDISNNIDYSEGQATPTPTPIPPTPTPTSTTPTPIPPTPTLTPTGGLYNHQICMNQAIWFQGENFEYGGTSISGEYTARTWGNDVYNPTYYNGFPINNTNQTNLELYSNYFDISSLDLNSLHNIQFTGMSTYLSADLTIGDNSFFALNEISGSTSLKNTILLDTRTISSNPKNYNCSGNIGYVPFDSPTNFDDVFDQYGVSFYKYNSQILGNGDLQNINISNYSTCLIYQNTNPVGAISLEDNCNISTIPVSTCTVSANPITWPGFVMCNLNKFFNSFVINFKSSIQWLFVPSAYDADLWQNEIDGILNVIKTKAPVAYVMYPFTIDWNTRLSEVPPDPVFAFDIPIPNNRWQFSLDLKPPESITPFLDLAKSIMAIVIYIEMTLIIIEIAKSTFKFTDDL